MAVLLKQTLRSLAKSPGFTLVVVLTLALGIGANTAIFTLANAIVLRGLPYEDAHELTLLNERSPNMDGMSVAWLNFVDWRERNRTFEALAATRREDYNLTSVDEPLRVSAMQATHELFPALGLRFTLGRPYSAEEDHPGAPPTTVLSYRLWSSAFGQDASVVGRSITLHGRSYEVVGVAAPETDPRGITTEVDLFTPLGLNADMYQHRGDHPGIYVAGRMRDGVTLAQASEDMNRIARELQQEYPASNTGNLVRIRPLSEATSGGRETPMKVLLAAVGFVLLIVCANVANLLLARGARRRSEMAVRAALGASRTRLIRDSLLESFVLAGAGAALGVVLANATLTYAAARLPEQIPPGTQVAIDGAALAFTIGVTALAAILFGLAPALDASRVRLAETMAESGRGGSARRPLRAALVVAEIAVASVLLVGSALMMRSFWNVIDADPGYDADGLLVARFSLPAEQYGREGATQAFADALLERVRATPGVEEVGLTQPLLGGWQMGVYPEGFPEPEPGQSIPVDYARVTPGHLAALGVKLIAGRYFDEHDARGVVIVDETFAEKYWPGENAVGKRVRPGGFNPDDSFSEIVGVVSHVKNYGVDQDSRIELYMPYKAFPSQAFTLVVRSDQDPERLAGAVRGLVREIDPQLPVYGVQSMRDLLGENLSMRKLASSLMSLFAAAALALAALGIYGVMSYSVSERRREVGLRMALGAQRAGVLSLVVGQAARLIVIGLAIGLGGALALSRLLETMLFGVGGKDALSYAGVGLVLALAGAAASLAPAIRAARIQPMEALRTP